MVAITSMIMKTIMMITIISLTIISGSRRSRPSGIGSNNKDNQ